MTFQQYTTYEQSVKLKELGVEQFVEFDHEAPKGEGGKWTTMPEELYWFRYPHLDDSLSTEARTFDEEDALHDLSTGRSVWVARALPRQEIEDELMRRGEWSALSEAYRMAPRFDSARDPLGMLCAYYARLLEDEKEKTATTPAP